MIGRLEDVRLEEKEGKARCRLVFDSDEFAEGVWQKVRSGTLKGVSVGFRVYEWDEVKAGKKSRDGIEGPAMGQGRHHERRKSFGRDFGAGGSEDVW